MVAGNRHNHKNEIYLRISHDVCPARQGELGRGGSCATLQQMQQEWFHCGSVGELAAALAVVEAGRQRSVRCR